MTTRKEMYEKYYNSDVFFQNPTSPSKEEKKIRVREAQRPLAKTKDDLFNTEPFVKTEVPSKKHIKRQKTYSKIYGSDIFFRDKIERQQNATGVKQIPTKNNYSNCFKYMQNNELFKYDLKRYEKEHRAPKKEYNPDIYIMKESPSERYFNLIYECHGSEILNERPFSTGPESRKNYAINKRELKRKIQQLNDCGVDQKKKPGEHNGQYSERGRYPKNNKFTNTDKKENKKQFVSYATMSPQVSCKVNKLMNLQSDIFRLKEKENIDSKKNLENLESRVNEERKNNYRDEYYHLDYQNPKRELKDNDKDIWGAVHNKWEKTNLDWSNPETEVMFLKNHYKEMNKIYGPKGPNAFQRKLSQLADSKNVDTITNTKKESLLDIHKPPSQVIVDGEGFKKIDNALNNIPSLKQDKKLKIRNNATTALIDGEKNFDKKVENLNKYYSDNRIIVNKKENKEKTGHDFSEYVLTYPVKGQFEKFGESDLKTIFGNKGVHVYDVQKNMFDKGTFNMFKFKVRENEGDEVLNSKINEIKKDLEKNNCKIQIDKAQRKDMRKKMKNFVSNPGAKIAILNENAGTEYDKSRFMKKPMNLRDRHSFSTIFNNVNYKYKQFK